MGSQTTDHEPGRSPRDTDVLGSARRSEVQSIDRAVAILSCFTIDRRQAGVSEIARLTGLTTSTAHRLVASLTSHELLKRTGGAYELGPRILRLAQVAHATLDLQQVALPVMRRLRDETGETVGLNVLRGLARVVIDQVESREPLRRTYTGLGEPIPIHQGAPGKMLLAHLPEHDQESVLTGTLEPATPRTITDPEKLRVELEKIRRDGYAFSVEERVLGIRTVAVPVCDHTDGVVATLSVTGPSSRMSCVRLHEMVPAAVRAARDVSAALGHADPASIS